MIVANKNTIDLKSNFFRLISIKILHKCHLLSGIKSLWIQR